MKQLFGKCLSVVCIFILCCGVFLYKSPTAKAIKELSVDVQPRRVSAVATYKFHFTIEKDLDVYNRVTLVFPPGTTFTPPIPEDEKEKRERLWKMLDYIYFGTTPCGPCASLPRFETLSDGSLQMEIMSVVKYAVKVNPKVVITIYPQAGFTNPSTPGKVIYKLSTQYEKNFVEVPYEFFESKLSVIKVNAIPSGFHQMAKYAISFSVGMGGMLKAGNDFINITFPSGTTFSLPPSTFRQEWILINGSPIGAKLMDTSLELKIPVPLEIKNAESVEVVIDSKAGIINPKKPGDYQIEVSTTADLTQKSLPYKITRTEPILQLETNKVNRKTAYTIQYIQDFAMDENGKITILFPESVQLPQTKISDKLLVNGKGVDSIDSRQNTLIIYPNQKLNIAEPVFIEFTKEFGIQNPVLPGPINITFKPDGYKSNLITSTVNIVPQLLEITDVYIDDAHALVKTDYLVKVIFDDAHIPKIGEKFILDLGTPGNVFDGEVDVDLAKAIAVISLLDIKNPITGTYTATLSFADQKASCDYVIFPGVPVSEAKLSGGKMGNNEWWVEPPTVSIETQDQTAEILYSWEGERDGQKTKMLPYSEPMKLYYGQYKTRLLFYARNAYGTEEIKTLNINVDTINPEFEIHNPKQIKTETRDSTIKIEGRSIKSKIDSWRNITYTYDSLFINHKEVTISPKDGTFSLEVDLIEGENSILIHAEDEAGNFFEKTYSVTKDTTSPEINIISPLPNEAFHKNPVTITGKTEPSARLHINGNEVPLDKDGSFQFSISLINIGQTTIYFTAIDPLGNESKKELKIWFGYTIQLQIGSNKATTNGVEKHVPLAPFIQQGRTLVPFRFIGEELNAKIDFTLDPRTKQVKTVSYELKDIKILLTIRSRKAIVNDKEIELEVPAQIVKGSTVVPLRFVTEGLNCRLNWDPETQRITIWYPKFNI